MQASLYDILRGHFEDGSPVRSVSERRHRMLSVISNLTHLFNTRQGAIPHLPDYGLPDTTSVYHDVTQTPDVLAREIRSAVQKYEPRLTHVRIDVREGESATMRMVFILTANLEKGQRIRLQTTFAADDLVRVNPWTRAE